MEDKKYGGTGGEVTKRKENGKKTRENVEKKEGKL